MVMAVMVLGDTRHFALHLLTWNTVYAKEEAAGGAVSSPTCARGLYLV